MRKKERERARARKKRWVLLQDSLEPDAEHCEQRVDIQPPSPEAIVVGRTRPALMPSRKVNRMLKVLAHGRRITEEGVGDDSAGKMWFGHCIRPIAAGKN